MYFFCTFGTKVCKMKYVLLWTALLFAGCSSGNGSSSVEPLRVETVVAAPSAAVGAASYVGTVEEDSAAALSFPVAGTCSGLFAAEGRHVRRGDLLAELDAASARQAFDAAEASMNQARDAYDRLKRLYEAETVPEIKWVEAQTSLRQAEAMCEIARKNLDDCKLYAPFTGVVGKCSVSVGETALPGVPVMTLLKIDTVKVRFAVPEREIAGIRVESRIEAAVAALGGRSFTASRMEKGAAANPAAHTYDVRASLANPSGDLLPGMVCRVVVTPAGAVEEIAVPVAAVQQAGDGSHFVWTVTGGTARRRQVVPGRFCGDEIVVADGLRAGDRVVIRGMQKIGEGSQVVWE